MIELVLVNCKQCGDTSRVYIDVKLPQNYTCTRKGCKGLLIVNKNNYYYQTGRILQWFVRHVVQYYSISLQRMFTFVRAAVQIGDGKNENS